jgi:hypothetical protein
MAIAYNSNFDLTIPFSDVCAQIALVQNTDITYVVPGPPTTKYAARFSMTSITTVFIRLNGVPTIPAPNTVNQEQYNEMRAGADNTQRYVNGGDVIHFITPTAAAVYVGVSLRQLPG